VLAPTSGLTRITVRGPRRRVDLAVPHQVPLAELLPELLFRAGEATGTHDPSAVPPPGGWVLRRGDGTPLAGDAGLAGQGVRDGDVLYLVPGGITWPEPAYDDVVEEIAAGARAHGRVWDAAVGRAVALAAAAAILVAGAGLLATAGAYRAAIAGLAAVVSAGLLLTGGLLSRALGDGGAGAVAGGLALPYAAVAGLQGAGPGPAVTADRLLVAASAVLLAAVLGAVAVGSGRPAFVAGATVAVGAGVAALVSYALGPTGAAAILAVVLVFGIGLAAPVAVRLGRIPVPLVTADPDVLAVERRPDRAAVASAVARADDILAGCLLGIAAVSVGGVAVLAGTHGTAASLLGGLTALALLLRARLFPAVAARLPLLAGGLVALVVVSASWFATAGAVPRLVAAALALAVAVTLLATAAVGHGRPGGPSPYLVRLVEVADVVVVLALAPTAFAVLGLYTWVRTLAG
jgi:type VII secretion integral membrane protein EccD